MDEHTITCGLNPPVAIAGDGDTPGASNRPSTQSSTQQQTSQTGAAQQQEPVTLQPGQAVGEGARRRETSSPLPLDVIGQAVLPPQQRTRAAQEALRRTDNDGALTYLRERQGEVQDLVEKVANLRTWLSLGPSPRRVAECNHNVNALAICMNANPQYDNYTARLLFASLPLQGDYFVTTPGGAHVANALVEPHMRDVTANTMQPEEIGKHVKGYPFVGQIYLVAGPWTLYGKIRLSSVKRSGAVVFTQRTDAVITMEATFAPAPKWDLQ